mmetsp:Transcript_11865/g.17023  ORF Transcript_11865/g.17023 Transcript_11865/m.17023 type:complete len:115 (-) Transcript_11865:184-528(-)
MKNLPTRSMSPQIRFINLLDEEVLDECAICLFALTDAAGGFGVTPCGHQFHLECWAELVTKMRPLLCPNCQLAELDRWEERFSFGGKRIASAAEPNAGKASITGLTVSQTLRNT